MPRLSKENQDFLLALERERHDTSWRLPKPVERYAPFELPTTPNAGLKTEVRKEQRKRDRIMFNAGRFAAGARDEEAIKASEEVAKLIPTKGNA